MTRRLRLCLLVAFITVVATMTVPATAAGPAAGSDDSGARARARLTEDASGRLVLSREATGAVRFVGTTASVSIDNPGVSPRTSVAAAARAHLDRYGAALGAAPGTTFVRRTTTHTASGVDAVSYVQEVAGVPVIAGDVVVSIGPDRELRSLQSTVSSDAAPSSPVIAEASAAETARGLVRRATGAGDLDVSFQGRGVLDPAVVEVSLPSGARTVWRFEVGDHAAVRQLVLVDDHTGQVLLRADLVEPADRVVCDRANARGSDTSCTSGFARTEGGAASVVPDVNTAFDLSGVVSDFYQQVDGIDLTDLLGIDVGGVKKLASTVRFCPPLGGGGCPYANAFWNGAQMFYGDGWADADDVVGHEMTHGVIDQFSELFYWGQSGAINESLADVIGEIVDHRHPSVGDAPGSWDLGEDSPVGTIRSLSDPTAFDQPDRTTSNLYDVDASYADNGGVHTNSGVGNKTAYLISQGGSFNGQTIAGIDGSDSDLTKSAVLYVDVIERLSSGADWAALAQQLDQSCQDLRTLGTAGFTASDCTAVHQAGVATELTTTPTNAATPADAPTTCPTGTAKRILLDSESGPATTFAPVVTGWTRESAAGTSNATSGIDSWYAEDPGGSAPSSAWIETNPLRSSASISLPAGQQSFLSFQNWYVFDYDPSGYYDGGTVEVGVDGGVPTIGSTNAGSWVNGPNRTLASGFGNTGAGQPAYSGDSHGWSVSRLDLTPLAGHTVRPQFTMRSDNQYGAIGWYLDDIEVYTCDPVPTAPRNVRVTGLLGGMRVSWTPPAVNAGAVATYQVGVAQCSIQRTVSASTTAVSLTTAGRNCGSRFDVSVVAISSLGAGAGSAPVVAWQGMPSLRATRHGAYVTFKGTLAASTRWLVGATVLLQRKSLRGWVTIKTLQTRRYGRFGTTIRHRKPAYYRVAYLGGPGIVGKATARHRW